MGRHASTRRSRSGLRLLRLRALLAGGLVLGLGATATLAAWNDSEHATGTITAGSFGIVGATDGATFTEHPAAPGATLTLVYNPALGVLAPGSTATTRASVRLAAGSVPGTVTLQQPTFAAIDTAADTALQSELRYSVRVVTGTTATAVPDCATVFSGSTGTLVVNASTLTGAIAPGSQSLAQGATPTVVHYCVQLQLPSATATNGSQNGSFDIRFQLLGST
ncbi:SipW-dependent-type signal peptide-containing protein [Agrococcus jejuensis]|uniref:SipW-dependent-type signal peptide-containing protein n=1 Tax=Agrococcus jejuensis TaxID=399736 RepID=UPI0021B544BB|nr:SipW-dependent-type signal peptide-containing protein [Agrococcus jejuensis]